MDLNQARHVPIISDAAAKKRAREEEIKLSILNNPTAYNKLQALAESLDENFNSTTKIMANLRVGGKLKDNMAKKTWVYEYMVMPFIHDVHTKIIMDLAKKPLTEFEADYFIIVYEDGANPAPRFVMSMIDFCKYVATGVWTILDLNNQPEEEFLQQIKKG